MEQPGTNEVLSEWIPRGEKKTIKFHQNGSNMGLLANRIIAQPRDMV
jgi:hypothetical protein